MNKLTLLGLIFVALAFTLDIPGIDEESFMQQLLNIPQKPTIVGMKWKNCVDDPQFGIQSLSASPDPLVLGKNATFEGSAFVKHEISDQYVTSVDIVLKKKVFGVYVKIPCLEDLGSCTYTDLCAQFNSQSSIICPILTPFNIPCKCPIAPGTYGTPAGGVSVYLENPGISWLTSGDFQVTATINSGKTVVGCSTVELSLA